MAPASPARIARLAAWGARLAAWGPRCAALGAVLAACDPQAQPGYQGQPLVTLHGQVSATGPLPPLEAAMLWQRGAPPSTDDPDLATKAPVTTGFPATFTLRLFQPPPTEALQTLAAGQPLFARANAAAVPLGTSAEQLAPVAAGAANNPNASYGLDADHWVIFLAAPAVANTLTEWWLGGAAAAGFHLYRVAPRAPGCLTGAPLEACVAELVARGVADDGTSGPGTARGFCAATYRLAPVPDDDPILLKLGSVSLEPGTGEPCP